ncbi:ATP-dependent exoDNAse (exonuclease V) beta subunit [Aquimarina sp. MAR_2010_214]|uniref:UvrD-helicase domain-containing protein n=1 Tax=Aquimarina sp. MAR_2010_214 TaxID=1250026 RepID=UPI000C7109F4|nr:UvrD-helicase domain-containing protein [Aquimarina sp. MAR_2010_214]PKV48639.1 ATP-dependent exoDNAse (exonuclease V) beta subunit [Aquimarina sp. MAR_2010_214]
MNSTTAFIVYNAAAGAGKTYTLVKAYLIALLKGEYRDSYKNILAITFTNKAVAEMKSRILENLVAISELDTPSKYQDLLNELSVETKIPELELKQKAKRILRSILHNYAAFDVVTIDTFTHRVIRTFAHDLGIPMNFEIEMDTDSLIEEAVDAVVAKIGLNEELTKLIIDFAISKLEDDKSWDITIELNKIARLLFSENDRGHLNKLSHKTIANFESLKKQLSERVARCKKDIISESNTILQVIKTHGVEYTDFTRSSIPNHFLKLTEGDVKVDFKAAWKQNIQEASFYSTKLDSHKKELIDSIRSSVEEVFLTTKQLLIQIGFFKNVIKNLTPLSVLNAINKELIGIKKERKILLISEFNTIISKAIKDQPAPFIYERLGERYRDYFIDEFQDTSELQWNNLIPLIDNAVSTETLTGKRGQVTIVGDAKQAIYRWRGGKAEQFINLSSDENPFSIQEKQVLNLPRNYRSHEEIIKFNNSLFTFLSGDFKNEKHRELYVLGNKQEVNSKKDGYVNISFIEAKNVAQENDLYPERVFETILELNKKGYPLNEICVIVRKQKEGTVIADFLTQKGLSIISSETLLIKNAPQVTFIIDLLTWCTHPEHLQSKINVLHFLTENFSIQEKHLFLEKMIGVDKKTFSSELKILGLDFDLAQVSIRPLYDAVEYIITSFSLADNTIAYVQFFLDVVFTFTQKHTEGIIGFLAYWHIKKDKLSIVAPETEEAIQIMTIHKAKGLEFPCVIYPYANIDIYEEIEPKIWLAVDSEQYGNFEEVFINYNKAISEYGKDAEEIVLNRQAQLELDAFNLLYVVLTRAEEQLYIVSNLKLNAKGESNPNTFSGKLIAYLKHLDQWNSEKTEYVFGSSLRPGVINTDIEDKPKMVKLSRFEDSSGKYKVNIVTNSGKLWDTSQQSAIEKGNLIHDLMASINTYKDVERVVEEAYQKGEITISEKEILYDEIKGIVDHPELSQYFSLENTVHNERDIISNGRLFRPDRIVIDKNNLTTIMDYKTGIHNTSHTMQIQGYASLLEKIGHIVKDKILIYFNDDITLKHV